jgi:hypothetical protein
MHLSSIRIKLIDTFMIVSNMSHSNNFLKNADAFQTSLCKLMNIRYPIVQAGMAGFTTPDLVAAVSNAGGLGILGASRLSSSQLQKSIIEIKQKTKYPFWS